jgi:predicted DNA-binding transcriptional regulator AlpA
MSTTQSEKPTGALLASITVIDRAAVCAAFGIHSDTLNRWIQRGEFPPPIFLTPSSNVGVWRVRDLEAHLEKRRRGRRVRKPRGFQRRARGDDVG